MSVRHEAVGGVVDEVSAFTRTAGALSASKTIATARVAKKLSNKSILLLCERTR